MQLVPVEERSPEAKLSYVQGYRAGALRALTGIENGLPVDIARRIVEQEVDLIWSTLPSTETEP